MIPQAYDSPTGDGFTPGSKPAPRGTVLISAVGEDVAPKEQLRQALLRPVELMTQPTIALVGSSRFSDPKWPANTTRRMVRNIARFIPTFAELNTVSSMSLQLPPYDLAVAELEDRIRAETKLTPLIPNLRKAKNIEFLTTPFVESALLHDDETFTHQYTVGSAIMTKLRLPPSKIGTLPRSALRLLGDASIEKVLVTEGIESLLAQRSIAPYSYAPQFPDDTPIVNVVGKTRTWPVFVTDPHANRAFAAYLKGESKLPETVDKLYGCIAAAGDASGYQLAVLRFPLELLADENSTTRLHTFFEAMQGSSASTVAIRSLGDCLSYVVANQDGAPTVDHAINLLHVPDRSVIAKYAARIDAIVEEFPRLSSERKIFAMIALDRGFEEAALGSGSHQDRIVLEAVHNALTDVVTRNRDIFDVMSSIPTNLAAPKLHQFGHAMLNRYSDVAAKYASLL